MEIDIIRDFFERIADYANNAGKEVKSSAVPYSHVAQIGLMVNSALKYIDGLPNKHPDDFANDRTKRKCEMRQIELQRVKNIMGGGGTKGSNAIPNEAGFNSGGNWRGGGGAFPYKEGGCDTDHEAARAVASGKSTQNSSPAPSYSWSGSDAGTFPKNRDD